jgi:sec-independent protein translocase protein TatC
MSLKKIFEFREDQHAEETKPFLEHLEDLRWMLVKMALTIGVAMSVSFGFRKELVSILQWPLAAVDPQMVKQLRTFGVTDSLTISISLAFYAGLVISFPVLLYFVGQFVLPALTPKEKRYVRPSIGIGFALFLCGVSFSYFKVLPETLAFFFRDAQSLGWTPTWTVREYFSFVTQMTLAFGLAFELPVVVLLLVQIGVVNFEFLRRTRAYAFILILVLAIVIAPTPDVLTFVSLGAPMVALYEICIWLAWWLERFKKRKSTIELPQ